MAHQFTLTCQSSSDEDTVVNESGIIEFSDEDDEDDGAILEAIILPTQISPPCNNIPLVLDMSSPEKMKAKWHGVAVSLKHGEFFLILRKMSNN